jgi:hypothetical protein
MTARARIIAAAVLLLSAGIGVLSHALTRTPMENDGWLRYLRLQTAAFLAASLLVIVVALPLMLFKSVRHKPWFRWVKVAMIGAIFIAAGWLSAVRVLQAEARMMDARGAEIAGAMRRYKSQYGYFPSSFGELTPTWLQEQRETDDRFTIGTKTMPDGTMSTVLWYWVGMRRKSLPLESPR